jgi:hypothetical protein
LFLSAPSRPCAFVSAFWECGRDVIDQRDKGPEAARHHDEKRCDTDMAKALNEGEVEEVSYHDEKET